MVSPPGPPPSPSKPAGEMATGCSVAAFDASSTLLATRLEDSPCTVWVWDMAAAELRAVLLFHSSVTFSWHPSAREELLISCQEDSSLGIFYVWDPTSQGPRPIFVDDYLPSPRSGGKPHASWLNRESEFPELVLSNTQHFALLSLADPELDADPWRPADGVAREDADAEADAPLMSTGRLDDGGASLGSAKPIVIKQQDATALDDTFSFRYA